MRYILAALAGLCLLTGYWVAALVWFTLFCIADLGTYRRPH